MRTPAIAFCLLLLAGGTAAIAAPASWAPDATDLQVCSLLAEVSPVDLADYLVTNAVVDIDGDGSLESLWIRYGGTAEVAYPEVGRADGTDVDLNLSQSFYDNDGHDDFRVDIDEAWLLFGDRVYLVNFGEPSPNYLESVDRIDATLAIQPLCKFTAQPVVELKAADGADQPICDAVTQRKVTYQAVQKVAAEDLPQRPVAGGDTMLIGKIPIDFANDGHAAPIYLLHYDSTAGKGCSDGYFDTKSEDRSSAAHKQLILMQHVTIGGPPDWCDDADPQWFTFKGVHYLEMHSTAPWTPQSDLDEYLEVAAIRRGAPATVCKAVYFHDQAPLLNQV